MTIVDVVLVAVLALAAFYGLRTGAIVLVFSFGGFLLGLYVGALLASITITLAHNPSTRTTVAMVTMLGVAALLGALGRITGDFVSTRLHRGILGSIDSGLGVAVALVTSLLSIWLLANTLGNSPNLSLNNAIAKSAVIRSLDSALPPPPSVFVRVQSFLSAEGFPSVFAGLAPTSSGPISVSDNAQTEAALSKAGPSTVKIVGEGCGHIQEGSGFVVAPGIVVTNAHVVAGIAHPQVEDQTGLHDTTVLLFDPSFDLAVMRVAGLAAPPLALDPHLVARSTKAVVLGYPGGGPLVVRAGGVMDEFEAEGRDIYGQGLTVRRVYEIQSIVRPGNSGGPLVEPDGEVIGVVFSRSTTNSDVGYALTSPGVLARVQRARSSSGAGTGVCTPD